jgi:RHS repeat-associated protein
VNPKARSTIAILGFAALVAMAFVGATSASATELCNTNTTPCGSLTTSVHEVSVGKAKLLTSLGNVECNTLFSSTKIGKAGTVQTIEGNFTYSSCERSGSSCTATEENGPSEIKVEKTAAETAKVTGEGLVHLVCGSAIDCSYNGVNLIGTGKGPFLSIQENGEVTISEQSMTKEVGGFLCPKTAKLDITVSPLSPIYLGGGGGSPKPTEGEKLCDCNKALVNMISPLVAKPVHPATGNMTDTQVDIPALGGRGPALAVARSYNSQLAASQSESGPFGYGWTGPYSASLSFNKAIETATVRQDNGATAVFYKKEGKYTPPEWDISSLKESGENWVFTLPSQEALEFNSKGQLVKETDRHGNALSLTYDKEGHLETVKGSAGRTLTFKFKEGHVESIKDPLGHEVKYAYESGNLAKVTLPGEAEPNWTFKYDASHELTEATDGRGHTTVTEYSEKRVKAQKDPLERKYSFEYKETSGVKETTITQPNGSKTLEKFNEMGEPTEITKALGTELAQTTKYKYDSAFELTELTDANGHVTKYTYKEGNKTSERDANENETKWAYNSTHDLTEETTPKGETTTITRNKAGDPETIKRPIGASTQEMKFKWAENGDLEEETDPLGHATKYEYDSYGDRKARIDPEGDKTTWGYDEDGRVTSEVSPRGNEEGVEAAKFETKTKRDAQGRPEVVTDPLGHETKYAYDAAGNLKEVVNPNGHATTYVYDADDERTEVKAANGDVSKTSYDSEGDVESKTDGNGRTTKYEHNALNELTKTTDPLKRETTRTYDAAGNLKELKDPEGRTTTYSYDAGNRLKEVKYTEEATKPVSYVYGKDGEVTEMKDGSGTTKKTYDELDRLTESTNGAGEVVKYRYDLGNEITEIVYPNAKAITQSFDKAGRLEAVKDWLGNETKFSYNRDSQPSSTTFPSATTNKDSYEYNAADQLAKTTMARGEETLASLAYGRDKAGQLESATQTGLPGAVEPKYAYDERERMTSGAGSSFKYDAADNPTEVAGTTQKFDEALELTEAGTAKYAYDKLGERTEAKPSAGPATKYGYDQAHNLVSVKRSAEGEVKEINDSYAYDGTGLRMSQTINGTTTHMAWDTTASLPLLLSDGTSYYLYGPGGLPFEQVAGETPTYLHHDQQGSTRLLTNSEGKATGKYTYTPYGAVEGHEGAASTPLGYDGQYRSEDTGLIYLRARIYDPATAQFMSVDPLVSETGEPYDYVADSPVNHGDPSGLQFRHGMPPPPMPRIPGGGRRPIPQGWPIGGPIFPGGGGPGFGPVLPGPGGIPIVPIHPPIVVFPILPPIIVNGPVLVFPILPPVIIPVLGGGPPIVIFPIGPPIPVNGPVEVIPIGPPIGVLPQCNGFF